MTPAELADVSGQMEDWSALEILQWAAGRFPRLSFATGFGAEGCVLIDLVARHRLPVDVFTLDTGLLFPETYALWRQLETRYQMTIESIRPELDVAGQARVYGDALWAHQPARCCHMRKVLPLRNHLKRYDAWITAIRRDQTATRASARHVEWDEGNALIKVNPLLRWTHDDVWAHLETHDVPFSALYGQSYQSIGCQPCTTPVREGEDARAGRWRGHVRTECGLHVDSSGVLRRSQVVDSAATEAQETD